MTIDLPAHRPARQLAAALWLCAAGLGTPALATADGSRTAAPPGLSCPRDQLTSYTGRVIGYRRATDHTWLRIATDWQTTEQVKLRHTKREDVTRQFLMQGQAFTPADWTRIEQQPGRLRKDVRATAWVCSDGRPLVVDWLPPREG
jgi:hypothetical protein